MNYIEHLKKVDEKIAILVNKYGHISYKAKYKDHKENFFENLVTSIIGQQLSVKVAEVIKGRLVNYLNGKIEPTVIINSPDVELRKLGLSLQKINYIKNLSNAIISEELDLNTIDQKADEFVIKELTRVKGIGQWTAEMFLIFSLKRPDVFSLKDVGLKNAMIKLYEKEMDKHEIISITEKWRPYRSYASMYLWRSLE